MLTPEQVRSYYDRFGSRQERQALYEDPAFTELIAHGNFEHPDLVVVELGCGTGRLAHRLLEDHLSAEASYRGFDVSPTMVQLTRDRLLGCRQRLKVEVLEDSSQLPIEPGTTDRLLCTYVIDLLPQDRIQALLAEAHRVLRPGGFICLASLTPGTHLRSWLLSRLWACVHWLRPSLVGGCRPVRLRDHLDEEAWRITSRDTVEAVGIASEVIIAERR